MSQFRQIFGLLGVQIFTGSTVVQFRQVFSLLWVWFSQVVKFRQVSELLRVKYSQIYWSGLSIHRFTGISGFNLYIFLLWYSTSASRFPAFIAAWTSSLSSVVCSPWLLFWNQNNTTWTSIHQESWRFYLGQGDDYVQWRIHISILFINFPFAKRREGEVQGYHTTPLTSPMFENC